MPGGIEGVRQMVADFHRRGVRVLFPMMMWDQGTHAAGRALAAGHCRADEADRRRRHQRRHAGRRAAGIFARGGAIGHPLAFEPEGSPSDEDSGWNLMNWGQYNFPFVPMVDQYKWLETRHMVNISDRWNAGQDRRPAIRIFQRRRLGELGECLGHLERHQSARCRGYAARRHDRARRGAVPREPGLGAALSHA